MAKTETQNYEVLKKEKNFEIRHYPSAMMATVMMAAKSYKELSSPGFRKLASFIFGANQAGQKIAMTTPVHMAINEAQSSMSFVMPAEYSIENLPTPNNQEIKIESSPEEFVAAIKFGGYANDAQIKKFVEKLENALKQNNIDYFGNFRLLAYNAPYQFLNRRNEIIVSIRWKK